MRRSLQVLTVSAIVSLALSARAQEPAEADPEPAIPEEAPPIEEAAPPAPERAGPAGPEMHRWAPPPHARHAPRPPMPTDRERVVGRWGIEARRLATLPRTPNQDRGCMADCPVDINALGVRRWKSPRYAWNAGLAFGLGGGASDVGDKTLSWDTFLGVGPTTGATFLLADWKHVAVGLSPQADFLFFMPGGSRPKTFLVDVRALLEAEIFLGFIGLPQVSLGLSYGLVASLRTVSDAGETPTATAREWGLGITAPRSAWDLVTNAVLRFYL